MHTALRIALAAALIAGVAHANPEHYGPYRATDPRVIDGDTIEITVHVWPGISIRTALRLDGVDAPEITAATACERALAAAARDGVVRMIAGAPLAADAIAPDKYGGRMRGRLIAGDIDIAAALLRAGHARPYTAAPIPWCSDAQ